CYRVGVHPDRTEHPWRVRVPTPAPKALFPCPSADEPQPEEAPRPDRPEAVPAAHRPHSRARSTAALCRHWLHSLGLFQNLSNKVARTMASIQLLHQNIVPRGAAGIGGARHTKNCGVVGETAKGSGLHGRGADFLKRYAPKELPEAFDLLVQQRH